jgi:ATP-dependent DNA ligase
MGKLPNDTLIDGEIVALDAAGKPSFNLLHGLGIGPAVIVMCAFDLLMWQGKDVRCWPLEKRRRQLRDMVQYLPTTRFVFRRRSTCRS